MKVFFDPVLNKLRRDDYAQAVAYVVSLGIAPPVVVANYAALPAPGTVSGAFYWAMASQGVPYIGVILGGTYYPSGMYYSNGVAWSYMATPAQATQVGVDAGVVSDQFVTPNTFANASKWSTKEDFITAGVASQYWRGDKTFQTLDTLVVTENTNLYFTNARAIGSVLTGYVSGAGVVAATDSILQAIQKLNGNTAALPSGTGVANRLTYWTGASTISSSANLLFTPNVSVSFEIGAGGIGVISAGGVSYLGDYAGAGNSNYLLVDDVANTINLIAGNVTGNNSIVTGVASLTSPILIGGTAVASSIIYKGSTNVAVTSTAVAHDFMVGNNASVDAMSIYHDGQVLVGTSTRIPNTLGIFRVGQGTSSLEIGESVAGSIAIWGLQGTNTTTNYSLRINSSNTILNNNGGSVLIANSGSTRVAITTSSASFTAGATTTGATTPFEITTPTSTNQTLSTEINGFHISMSGTGRQWAVGALTTQREYLFSAPTYRFTGASTITNAGTLVIDGAPIASTNAIITNAYALWIQDGKSKFGGNVELTQTVTTEVVVSDTTVTMVINGTTYKLLAKA
jgi:hypothetical protein